MKKTISIGDIHGRSSWKEALFGDYTEFTYWKSLVEENSPMAADVWEKAPVAQFSKIVFVGDYVDSFNVSNEAMIQNLRDIIFLKKSFPDLVVLLLGNHDIQYIVENQICSGYRPEVASVFSIIFRENLSLFDVVYTENVKGKVYPMRTGEGLPLEGDIVWTHAGISAGWLKYSIESLKRYGEIYEGFKEKFESPSAENVVEYLRFLWSSRNEVLFWCDSDSGGRMPHAGPFWIRPGRLNKNPLPFYQVVGHTHKEEIRFSSVGDKFHIFIDVLDSRDDFLIYEEII
jgi:hypothetical protein